jgi:FKBP-type peptidyl-prolyl cis-trans isomerase (trigger factor)
MKKEKKRAKLKKKTITITTNKIMTITDLKINPAEEGELEITGELAVAEFAKYREKALKNLGQDAKVDGFRPGHIPENVLVEQVGEEKVLWEMAQEALNDLYPQIVTENKIAALGRPEITITKIAPENPLGFKIKTAIMPEIKIADYKEIALSLSGETSSEPEVSPEEVDKVLEDIRKSRATAEHAKHEHKEGEKCEHEAELPELNDDFAKSLGQFQTLDELKAKIKENLGLEKKNKAKDKKRVKIVEEVIAKSDLKIAKILVESEKDKMIAEMEGQIGQMGLNFEDYLTHLKKTKEELRDSWSKQARERVAFGLILGEVAHLEKITAPEDQLKNEVDYLKTQYKDIPEDRLRSYAAGLIVNEKVFEFLEGLK